MTPSNADRSITLQVKFHLDRGPWSHSQFGDEQRWVDRVDAALNRAAAFVILIALSPVLLGIAALVASSSGLPVFFGHFRVSRSGLLFRCLKFRTMYPDAEEMLRNLLERDPAARAEWEQDQKLTNDPRITPIGHFLRRTSLDELPQLINVVRGEMRLVGPRPITVQELARYGEVRWHYLQVQPGMTGLWQVSGRNNTTYEQRVALDRSYIEHRSLWLDLSILARTVRVVLLRHGAK